MRLALAFCCLAGAAVAQDAGAPVVEPSSGTAEAAGAMVRGLDKVSGALTDLEIATGASAKFGRLEITLGDCRYPADDPTSNAYAHLTIRDSLAANPVFDGWMIASSPALNALDHSRYDVWLIRCNIPAAEGTSP